MTVWYLNGGNYTVYGKEGPKGGYPTVTIRDTEWGGEARYGKTAGQVDWQ